MVAFNNYHTHKVSQLIIPKTGYTTITNTLGLDRDREEFARYESFCVIRNPKDRILSAYHEALRRGTFKGSLLECMQKIKETGYMDNHLFPATYYYTPVDHVFVFPDFQSVSRWLQVEITTHDNKTETKIDQWTDESYDLFEEIYQEEIEWYGQTYIDRVGQLIETL